MQLARATLFGTLLVLFSAFSFAATITINVMDSAGEGFNDTTAASPVGGNPGTTIGQQRLNLFQKAADILEAQIDSDVTIVVDAAFDPLYCDASSATLGQAGPKTVHWNFSGVPTNTAYPQALANSILGSDASAGTSDISATFNSNINGNAGCLGGDEWYYGYDEPTGANERDLLTVVLHEILHGLGFLTFVDITTGAKYGGSLDDPYSNNLKDKSTAKAWSAMNDTERLTSVTDTGDLVWTGTDVNANVGGLSGGVNGGEMQMYAPNPSQRGSSVSHFDTAATPNEVMEPQWTEWNTDVGLALNLLKDIGWTLLSSNTVPTITAVNQSTNEDVALTGVDASGWGSDADADSLTYSITTCPANVSCSINSDGTNLTLTPAANYNGATNTVTIQVDDGTDTASDTFNLNVSAQPDAPSINAIANQTTNEDTAKVVTLSGSDVDGDSLTYSVTSCPANITCSVSGTSLTLTPAANFNGATNSVTVQVSDGGLTDSTSFNLNVQAVNDAPSISVVDQTTNEDTVKVVDISAWGSDIDSGSLTYAVISCPANVSCSVSGSNLTLTPNANFNSSTNSVTLQVSDGSNSDSDTFNLQIDPVNDAPTISGLLDKTMGLGETKNISLGSFANDVDGDSLTYTLTTTCSANLTCSLVGSTLAITANSGAGTSESVTVQVSDGSLNANDSFDVTIQAAASVSIEASHSGNDYVDGDTVQLDLDVAEFTVSGGSAPYSFELDFNGSSVNGLLTNTTNSTQVALPESGEFAGDYTLTITDNNSDSIIITLKRPLRLVWSTTSILNGDTSHTLKVEGGAAGTTYTPVQAGDNSLILLDGNDAAIASVDAVNDADSFNAGVFNLDTHTVVAMTTTDVTIQSTYDDVSETGIKVYPAVEHSFTVVDTAGNAIANATAELDGGEALLADLKLALNFTADANGEFTLSLPDTSDTFAMTVSANGYNSEALTLDNVTTTHSVTLTEMANAITLSGSISALGSQDFLQDSPAITLTFADGTTESMVITVTTVSQASFSHQVDLNLKDLDRMQISQEDSLTIDMDISNVIQSQTYNILMERQVAVVTTRPTTNEPTDIGGGGTGGGSLGWIALIALGLLSIRKARRVNG